MTLLISLFFIYSVTQKAMRELYYKNGEGFVFIYSVTSRNSFEDISTYRDEVIKFKKGEPFGSILVGNKVDLAEQREVVTDEGRELGRLQKDLLRRKNLF